MSQPHRVSVLLLLWLCSGCPSEPDRTGPDSGPLDAFVATADTGVDATPSDAGLDALASDAVISDAAPPGDAGPHDAGRYDGGRDAHVLPCEPLVIPGNDALAQMRAAPTCAFAAGASTEQTLGIDRATADRIPIDHVIVIMQENRAFDHYFATLSQTHPDVEPLPPGYTNPDTNGDPVSPHHLTSDCLPDDPPHQRTAMRAQWNNGAMDGFVTTAAVGGHDGHYAIGYYDESDLPFYYWLARTYAFADHNFSSILGGTWPNRAVLYTGSNYGIYSTGERLYDDQIRTVFEQMTDAGVTWMMYSDGNPRTDLLGWTRATPGVTLFSGVFLQALAAGRLPQVSFVDPTGTQDEHPANDIHGGEIWTRRIVTTAMNSPHWQRLAIILTYDEGGGLFDHLPPPAACPPGTPDMRNEADVYGHRVPLYVISPYSRPGYVSHVIHDHASVLRFIQLLFDLPALTARDANADALLDMFDFSCPPPFLSPPTPPEAGGTVDCVPP